MYLEWSTAQAGDRAMRDVALSLSLMNRVNKTESEIFILYFGLVALEAEGATFHQTL